MKNLFNDIITGFLIILEWLMRLFVVLLATFISYTVINFLAKHISVLYTVCIFLAFIFVCWLFGVAERRHNE
jgi:hypothetical protein